MSKKILSVVLALVFIISTFAFSAFAIEGTRGEDEGATYKQTWVLENDGDADGDGVWTVYVKLTTTYKVGAMQFIINNPNDKVELTSAVLGEGVPKNYEAELSFNYDTGKVVIVPEPLDGAEAKELSEAIVAVLTYTVPDGESTTLTINGNDAKTENNIAGSLVALRMADGYLETGDMIFGQIVDASAAKTQLGSASAAPELAVIDGTLGVIDTTRTAIKMDAEEHVTEEVTGYIYGIDPYDVGETIESAFTVVGDGTMQIVANEAGFENGTGAKVNVLDLSGNVVATYVLIIFGDVNGDASADSLDIGDIDLHENFALNDDTGRLDPHCAFAGDVNGDYSADSLDIGDIDLHENYGLNDGTGRIDIAGLISIL